jgi:hypothetical protein
MSNTLLSDFFPISFASSSPEGRKHHEFTQFTPHQSNRDMFGIVWRPALFLSFEL